ncbi:MAG: YdeI/OmpD-associated family protein [Turneriella sp.]
MSKLKNAEKIYIPDRKTLRAWFVKNHAQVESFWLVYDKVKDGKRHLTYDDLVEESLCFGFIDSQPRKVSETQASYYISRRKPRSEWSKRNKEKVAELIKKKQMHSSGLAAIARAKENGSWSKIDGSENHVMPEDFAKILKKQPNLRKHFESLAPSMRKAFFHRLQSARTPETRRKRLDFLVQLLKVEIRPSEYRAAFTKGVIPER